MPYEGIYEVVVQRGTYFYGAGHGPYYQQGAADAKARELANSGTTVRVMVHKDDNTSEVCYELTGK